MTGPYAIVTAARDEADNLQRLLATIDAQTVAPQSWVIVENGSSDGTAELAAAAAATRAFLRVASVPPIATVERGGPIAQALEAGLAHVRPFPAAVGVLDADVELPEDYFERLLGALDGDAGLGIVSGACCEEEPSGWARRRTTPPFVWGAARLYRRECLEAVLPFERRTGWDAVDVAQANALGWRTRTLDDLAFRHHRPEASRERDRWRAWADQGRTSHFLGYRPSYLVLRALYQSTRDPAALGLVSGYLGAAARRSPRCASPGVREWVRSRQGLRAAANLAAGTRRQRDDAVAR